jgi:hypothetical protein
VFKSQWERNLHWRAASLSTHTHTHTHTHTDTQTHRHTHTHTHTQEAFQRTWLIRERHLRGEDLPQRDAQRVHVSLLRRFCPLHSQQRASGERPTIGKHNTITHAQIHPIQTHPRVAKDLRGGPARGERYLLRLALILPLFAVEELEQVLVLRRRSRKERERRASTHSQTNSVQAHIRTISTCTHTRTHRYKRQRAQIAC